MAEVFRTEIRSNGKTAAGIAVPPEVVESLGQGRRPPVTVTIAGHSYRSSVAVMGGEYLVGVSMENRRLAGVEAGDVVDVRLELDTEPRDVVVPADLAVGAGRGPRSSHGIRETVLQQPAAARARCRGREDRRDPPAPNREDRRDPGQHLSGGSVRLRGSRKPAWAMYRARCRCCVAA